MIVVIIGVFLAMKYKESLCPKGSIKCNNNCTNTLTDSNNCGKCGIVCPTGQSCVNGVCTCIQTGATSCNGVCKMLNNDPDNCGGCGITCASSQSCYNGNCVNCITSANCGINQTCINNNCVCSAGYTLCNGSCINKQTDSNNCGGCGNVCTSGKTCYNGSCTSPLTPSQVTQNAVNYTGMGLFYPTVNSSNTVVQVTTNIPALGNYLPNGMPNPFQIEQGNTNIYYGQYPCGTCNSSGAPANVSISCTDTAEECQQLFLQTLQQNTNPNSAPIYYQWETGTPASQGGCGNQCLIGNINAKTHPVTNQAGVSSGMLEYNPLFLKWANFNPS
jgi:hypothetical protein